MTTGREETLNELKKDLRKSLKESEFHGVISLSRLSDYREDKLSDEDSNTGILQEACGFLDWANELPVNMETKFGIASGTKFFTALCIFKLIEEGQLSLDSRVFDILDYSFERYDSSVTVGQLLSHRSGIPDYYDESEVEDFDNFTVGKPWQELIEPKDYFEIFPKKGMMFKPGSDFFYNNSGYILLAALIHQISGGRFSDYVTRELFQPLGMKDSGFYPLNQLPKNTATGYVIMDKGYRSNIYNLPLIGGGDGGAYTSVKDMAILWNAFYSGQIVALKTVEIMTSRVSEIPDEGEGVAYGYGVWMDHKHVYIEGCDAGVSFRSGTINQELVYTLISNTAGGIWKHITPVYKIGEEWIII